MLRSSRLRHLSCAVLIAACCSGCHLLCRDRMVTVQAKDAETGQPLPAADVVIAYTHTSSPFAGADSSAKTNEEGLARLTASPADEFGARVMVAAPGYLSEEKTLTAKEIEAIEPAPFLVGAIKDGPPTFVMALYSGPRPTVELVVPNGFRGLVKARIEVQDGAVCPPGQRCFVAKVSPQGETKLTGPGLLRQVGFPDFSAKYEDGKPILRDARHPQIGLWCLTSEGGTFTFLVGTRGEYEERRPTWGGGGAANKPSRGDQGGMRRGGRHRRPGGGIPSF